MPPLRTALALLALAAGPVGAQGALTIGAARVEVTPPVFDPATDAVAPPVRVTITNGAIDRAGEIAACTTTSTTMKCRQ
jgi:hypothetical protein